MRRRYWIVLVVVAAAVAAAGGAVAATKLASPSDSSKAVINDAAHRLNVSPGALSSALRKALDDQVDAAVASGRLSKEQGDAIKKRLDSRGLPIGALGFGFGLHRFGLPGFGLHGPPPGFRFRPELRLPGMFGRGLHAVTSYLGITPAQLRNELAAGKSLGQIAQEHGKTAAGLVSTLVSTVESKLAHAVAAGHLTAAQEQKILSGLRAMFQSLVSGKPLLPMHGLPPFGFGFGRRFRGHHLGRPSVAWPRL